MMSKKNCRTEFQIAINAKTKTIYLEMPMMYIRLKAKLMP